MKFDVDTVVVVRGTAAVGCEPEWCGNVGVIAGADFEAVKKDLGAEPGLVVRLYNEVRGVYETVEHAVLDRSITFELPCK